MHAPLDDSYLLTLRALADLDRRLQYRRKREGAGGPAPLYPGRPGLARRRAAIARGVPCCEKTITRHMRVLQVLDLVFLAEASPGGRPEGRGIAHVWHLRGKAWDTLAGKLNADEVADLAARAPRRRGRPRGQPATGAAGRPPQGGHNFPAGHTVYDRKPLEGAAARHVPRAGGALTPGAPAPGKPGGEADARRWPPGATRAALGRSPWGAPPPRPAPPQPRCEAAQRALEACAPALAAAMAGRVLPEAPPPPPTAAEATPAPAAPHAGLRHALQAHAPWLAQRLAQGPPPEE